MENKKKYTVTFLTFFALCCTSFAQKINKDAVNKFWHIVDYLKTDKPLNDSLWSSYYNLYGNKNYMENNRDENQPNEHRKYLEFAFRPSLTDSLLLEERKPSDRSDDILKNLIYVKQNEKGLRAFTKEIDSHYLEACISLAKKYLPKNKYDTIPKNLRIYVNAMVLDGAYQDGSMYWGLSQIYEYDKYQKGTIAAHEFHHVLRIGKEIEKKVSPADSATFSIIGQINNEGCADLIDKTIVMANEATIYEGQWEMKWLMDSAESTIKKLDAAFIANANATTKYIAYWDFRIMTNRSSGHTPGFYMANIIKRNGYEQELINNSDNPFKFFYLYNKAAAKDNKKPTTFSIEAIKCLKLLENRVW